MKKLHRTPWELIGAIFDAGLRAILVWLLIEIVLLVVATAVGIAVCIASGFLTGLVSGMVTFVIGQTIALLIIDMTFQLSDPPRSTALSPSDQEVLDALRKELES